MDYQRFIVGAIQTNCYLVYSGKVAGVIDPGGEMSEVMTYMDEQGLQLQWIINTHGHLDHIAGNLQLQQRYGVPIWIHEADREMLTSSEKNLSAFMNCPVISPDAARSLAEGDLIYLGEETLKVLHTPGHTPGGISLITKGLAFTGDALFCENVGRTDFPGGDYDTLITAIKEKLLTLPGDTLVLPGHDCSSTIAHELSCNQYLSEKS